jgi:hypothetical protein
MAAQLSLKSAVQKHVLDHVWQMIDLHVVLVDGKPHDAKTLQPLTDGGWRRSFYVCPASGRLLMAPRHGRPLPEPARDRRRLDDTHEAWRIDGIWYRVRFAPVPAARAQLRDVILKRYLNESGIERALTRLYGHSRSFAVAKQQMSWREIANLARATR